MVSRASQVGVMLMLMLLSACGLATAEPEAGVGLGAALTSLQQEVTWAFAPSGHRVVFIEAALPENCWGRTSEDGVVRIDTAQTPSELLPHVMAHELGHALGLHHVDDPLSLMYPYTTARLPEVASFSAELRGECYRQFAACKPVSAE